METFQAPLPDIMDLTMSQKFYPVSLVKLHLCFLPVPVGEAVQKPPQCPCPTQEWVWAKAAQGTPCL